MDSKDNHFVHFETKCPEEMTRLSPSIKKIRCSCQGNKVHTQVACSQYSEYIESTQDPEGQQNQNLGICTSHRVGLKSVFLNLSQNGYKGMNCKLEGTLNRTSTVT